MKIQNKESKSLTKLCFSYMCGYKNSRFVNHVSQKAMIPRMAGHNQSTLRW